MASARLDFPHVFSEISLGNAAAAEFCRAFLEWVHLIDDFIDADVTHAPEKVIRVNLEALLAFADNEFWLAHHATLLPLLISGVKAYADSNRWAAKPDFRDRATSDVLKSQYQEVLWYVAMICGGYSHYDAMTQKYRSYFYDVHG